MKKSKLAILVSSLCSGFLLLAGSFSLAWFYQENKIDLDDGLTGSVLQKYFHSGNGSKEKPFIITRPRHYENMVLLHYNLEGFAEKKFYFEFGTDLDGNPETIEMYNYTNGKLDTSVNNGYSTTLNCDHIASLAPLGSYEKPFNAHIQGNNMTISGFKIDATRSKYSDIGIFGFVGDGTCLNAYFSDFEIDTTGTAYDAPTKEEIANGTDHSHVNGAVHFGYIAGHLDETHNFQNVYVNNCTIKGTTNGLQVNNYGYYGRAEQDSLGGGLGYGRDYQFSLNSQAVFNYFNTTYDSIKDNQLVLKNTRETYNENPNDNGDKIKRMTSDGQTVVPFSNAVSPDSAALARTYVINNGYSLSTAGYTSPEFVENRHEYNVYYEDRTPVAEDKNDNSHDGQIKMPKDMPYYYDYSLKGNGEGLIVDTETGEEAPTPYFYFNNAENKYYYGESYDRKVIKDYDVYPFDMTFENFPQTTFQSTQNEATIRNALNVDARLFFDDSGISNNIYNSIKLDATATIKTGSIWNLYRCTIDFSIKPIHLEKVQQGKHHYSVLFSFTYPTRYSGTHRITYVYGNYSAANNTLSQMDFEINDESKPVVVDFGRLTDIDNNQEDIANNATKYDSLINPANNLIKRTSFSFEDSKDIIHRSTRTFESPLLFKEVINGVEQQDFITVGDLGVDDHTSFDYVPGFDGMPNTWKLVRVSRDIVDNQETLNYFPTEDNLIYESGYRSRNIDVIGGGTEFYYQAFGNTSIAVLSLSSERGAGEFVGQPPAKGEMFYANESCRSSIVVYLKNTSNAVDDRDDTLGKISFTFVRPKIIGFTFNTVDPVFKKGDGFLSLNKAGTNIGESQDNALFNITHNISVELMESDVKKVAYCGLDAEGRVVGRYNADGTTDMTEAEQVKIDTYVLVLGGQSNNGYDTWITNIDFEYKAQDGYGGTFGSIGYRSAGDTIENTIVNFYFQNPGSGSDFVDFEYYINTRYVKNNPTTNENGEEIAPAKKGTYYITCYADKKCTLQIYNYYSEQYDVYYKTDPGGGFALMNGSTAAIQVPASNIPS